MKKSINFNLAAAGFIGLLASTGYGTESAMPQNSSTASQPMLTPVYTVIKCNDGDTCRLRAADNTQVKVRLIGIDSPENGKKRGKKKVEGQPGASESKEFLNALIAGKGVLLKSYGVDMYGRNLAEIVFNDESVNLKMVSEGWAEVYRGKAPTGFNISPYIQAEDRAKQSKKGIWAMPGYESPKAWRKKNK